MTTVDISAVRTPKTGKSITDFKIPEKLRENDPELVMMVLETESMDDDERQYWFNLADVMRPEQIEKLRGILTREREKMAEIEKKYGPKKPELTPEEQAEKTVSMQQKRAKQQAELRAREEAHEESEDEDSILAELDNL